MHAQDEKVIQNWMRWQIWISSQRASRLQTVCGDWLTGRHLQDSFAALLPAVSHEQRKGKWRVTEPLSLIVTDQCNAIWRLKTKTCQSALLQLCFVKVWFVVIDHTLSSTIWHSRVQWCKIFCWVQTVRKIRNNYNIQYKTQSALLGAPPLFIQFQLWILRCHHLQREKL